MRNFRVTIKNYLKNNRPIIALSIVYVFFLTNILTLLSDEIYNAVVLFPQDIKNILTWYKLVTYPFYTNGLVRWLHNGLVIVIAGYIVEQRLSRKKVIVFFALTSIIGGLIYSIINVDDPLNRPIASPVMISWGLFSCAFILILKRIKSSLLFEKIVFGLFIISLLFIDFIDFGFFAGRLSVIIFGMLYGLIFDEKIKN